MPGSISEITSNSGAVGVGKWPWRKGRERKALLKARTRRVVWPCESGTNIAGWMNSSFFLLVSAKLIRFYIGKSSHLLVSFRELKDAPGWHTACAQIACTQRTRCRRSFQIGDFYRWMNEFRSTYFSHRYSTLSFCICSDEILYLCGVKLERRTFDRRAPLLGLT